LDNFQQVQLTKLSRVLAIVRQMLSACDRTMIGKDDDIETVVESLLETFNQRCNLAVDVRQHLVHLTKHTVLQLNFADCNKGLGCNTFFIISKADYIKFNKTIFAVLQVSWALHV